RLAVLLGGRRPEAGRLGAAAHTGAVDLAGVEEALARDAHRLRQPVAVGLDRLRGVLGQGTEVEGRIRRARDAAVASREQRVGAREVGGDVLALPAEGRLERRAVHAADATRTAPRPARRA